MYISLSLNATTDAQISLLGKIYVYCGISLTLLLILILNDPYPHPNPPIPHTLLLRREKLCNHDNVLVTTAFHRSLTDQFHHTPRSSGSIPRQSVSSTPPAGRAQPQLSTSPSKQEMR
ncbi:hypothetical protein BaRGS_00018011 [Batillaria attramentaria]|uniref:Uncharacterized protein n=1 Tax=Batillaria attramentaria TaxID=370345 RepID=A0ABD0KVJ2_9CAEN